MSMQLSSYLQKFIAKNCMSASKLQTNHKFGAKPSNSTRIIVAGNVPCYMRSLFWYILSEFAGNLWSQTFNHFLNKFWTFFSLQFNTLHNALARCPHCRKVSSVGPEFTRNRGILFLGLGILFLIIGITVTWSTYSIAEVRSSTNHPIFFYQYRRILINFLHTFSETWWNLCSLYRSFFDCTIPFCSHFVLLYAQCEHHWWTHVIMNTKTSWFVMYNQSVENRRDEHEYPKSYCKLYEFVL